MTLHTFHPGDGINSQKLNENFSVLQGQTNDNETAINDLNATALRIDGSNMTQDMVDDFQQQTPIILSGSGNINLTDNSVHFLTLTGNNNNKIVLPAISQDIYSHTIILIVNGSNYSLNVANGTAGTMSSTTLFIPNKTYTVLYIYNKIDNRWYYSLGQ